jgi:formate dehydrogenase major subunit
VQWGEKVVEPIFEAASDYLDHLQARPEARLRQRDVQEHPDGEGQVRRRAVRPESILREINRGGWSTGYTGQSPERIKAHMANQDKFDIVTLRAPKELADIGGDFYGLPWPCWGKPEVRHPGTHILYNTNLRMMDGGGAFRPRFGLERNGETLLAQNSWNLDSAHPGRLSRSSPTPSSSASAGTPT